MTKKQQQLNKKENNLKVVKLKNICMASFLLFKMLLQMKKSEKILRNYFYNMLL